MLKKCLLAIFAFLAFFTLTGCSLQNKAKIPFMIFIDENFIPGREPTEAELQRPDRKKAILGFWDLETGKVSFAEKPLFRIEMISASPDMYWDGGRRVVLTTTPYEASSVIIKDPHPKYAVEKIIFPARPGITLALSNSSAVINVSIREVPEERGKIFVEIRQKDDVRKTTLKIPPFPGEDPYPPHIFMPFAPLLISGSPENYNLLITYEYSFQGKHGASLLLANVRGDKVNWKKVEGVKRGYIAGAGSQQAILGKSIYLATDIVEVINLESKPLAVKDYKPANELVRQIEDKALRALEGRLQLSLGSFGNTLLVGAPLSSEEHVIWAIQDNQCQGKMYIDRKQQKIMVYRKNILTDEKPLPEGFCGLRWPMQDCGTLWNYIP